jgi:very-short-patch-repair endonuclease
LKSELEETLALLIRVEGLPEPEREYRFCERRWRFDFAYPEQKIGIECEGGTWAGGRHTRGSGFEKDCEKYNQAAIMGWKVLRFTKGMIDDGTAIETIKAVL